MKSSQVNEIDLIKEELLSQLSIWLNNIIEKTAFKHVIDQIFINLFQLTKQFLDQLFQDMGLQQKDSKTLMLQEFPQHFLNQLKTNPNSPAIVENVQQLLVFAQHCLNDQLPVIQKYQILKDIVRELNLQIQNYFRANKLRIIELGREDRKRSYSNPQQLVKQRQSQGQETPQTKLKQEQLNVKSIIKKDPDVKLPKKQEIISSQPESKSSVHTQKPTTSTVEKCPHCLCSKGSMNISNLVQTNKSPVVKCRICENFFHTVCMQIEESSQIDQFLCPECIILRLDPIHRIIEVLCEPVPFKPTQHAPTKTFTFQLGSKRENRAVELRCIKLDGKNGAEEPTWPDVGDLAVNGKRILEFKPLQKNSSLKKRKDEKFTSADMIYYNSNVMQLREGVPTADQRQNMRVQTGQVYFVGVFLVELLSVEKFIQDILSSEESYIPINKSKEIIRLYMQRCSAEDVQVQQVTVSLNCFFDTQKILTPVRGSLCEHIQCFSLENMIKMMHRISPRKWRCPICKCKSVELMIDGYQQLLLKLIRDNGIQIDDVSFNKKGEVEQQELQKLIDGIPLAQFLSPFAIDNQNRILQLEQLKKQLNQSLTPIQIIEKAKDNDSPDIEIFEPPLRKQLYGKDSNSQKKKDQKEILQID